MVSQEFMISTRRRLCLTSSREVTRLTPRRFGKQNLRLLYEARVLVQDPSRVKSARVLGVRTDASLTEARDLGTRTRVA